jgi:hypothetical protein
MRAWLSLLAGLLIWAVNFFAIYVAVSLWPGSITARIVSGVLSLAGLAAVVIVYLRLVEVPREGLNRWIDGGARVGLALAGVAMIYHGITAVLA